MNATKNTGNEWEYLENLFLKKDKHAKIIDEVINDEENLDSNKLPRLRKQDLILLVEILHLERKVNKSTIARLEKQLGWDD